MSRNRITPTDLLAWSVVNQATEREDRTTATAPHEPIDPKWIDVILGKPDAARMRGLSLLGLWRSLCLPTFLFCVL